MANAQCQITYDEITRLVSSFLVQTIENNHGAKYLDALSPQWIQSDPQGCWQGGYSAVLPSPGSLRSHLTPGGKETLLSSDPPSAKVGALAYLGLPSVSKTFFSFKNKKPGHCLQLFGVRPLLG